MKNALSNWSLPVCLMAFVAGLTPLVHAEVSETGDDWHRVLILDSHHTSCQWSQHMQEGIKEYLSDSALDIKTTVEYLDSIRFEQELAFGLAEKLLSAKYSPDEFDLIIAAGDNALDFVLQNDGTLFGKTPVVFCGLDSSASQRVAEIDNITGVIVNTNILATINLAKKLHPDRKNLAVLAGKSMDAVRAIKTFNGVRDRLPEDLNVIELFGINVQDLPAKLVQLPDDTFVLKLPYARVESNCLLSHISVMQTLQNHSDLPVYVTWRFLVSEGVLGGIVADGKQQGIALAEIAVKILKSTPASQIPVKTIGLSQTVLDYEAVKKFKIPQSLIPQETVFVNKELTFFEKHKNVIFYASMLIFVQAVIIVFLIANRISRNRALKALRENQQRLDRIITNMPVMIDAIGERGKIVFWNSECERVTGYSSEEIQAMPNPLEILYPDPAYKKYMLDEITKAGNEFRQLEFEITCKDGSKKTISWSNISKKVPIPGWSHWATGIDITQRKKALEQLNQSTERLTNILQSISDGFFALDNDFRITFFNSAAERLLGRKAEQVLGKHIFEEAFPEAKGSFFESQYTDAMKSKEVKVFEVYFGEKPYEGWYDVRVYPYEDGICIFFQITTEKKQAQAALKRSEQLLSSVIRSAPIGIWVCDKDFNIQLWNEGQETMTGISADEVKGKNIFERFPNLTTSGLEQKYRNVVTTGEKLVLDDFEFSDESLRSLKYYLNIRANPLRDDDGTITGIVAAVEDITDRVLAEQQLKHTREILEQILETSMHAVAVMQAVRDNDGNIVDFQWIMANPMAAETLKLNSKEVPGKRMKQDKVGDVDNKVFDKYVSVVETGKAVNFEYSYHVDGDELWYEFKACKFHDGFVVEFEDITERQRTQLELAKSEQEYRRIVETAEEGIWIIDAHGNNTFANKKMASMLGYTLDEMKGKHLFDFIDPSEVEVAKENMQRRAQGIHEHHDFKFKCKDGSEIWVLISANPIFDKDGTYTGALGMVTDITTRKKAEQEQERLMRELESKNDELEALVYVASHDLRSPLVNIQGFSQELRLSCSQMKQILENADLPVGISDQLRNILDSDLQSSVDYISAGSDKIDTLLGGLLRLSRLGRASLDIGRVNVNIIIQKVIDSMQYQIQKTEAKVMVEDLPDCIGDPIQLSQVFTNLMDNALKYRHPDRTPCIYVGGMVHEGRVIYSVRDNGIGIEQKHQNKIFEIFNRLYPDSSISGEGLGLTIVKRILNRLNGKITLASKVDKGSTFYIILPQA